MEVLLLVVEILEWELTLSVDCEEEFVLNSMLGKPRLPVVIGGIGVAAVWCVLEPSCVTLSMDDVESFSEVPVSVTKELLVAGSGRTVELVDKPF